MGAVLFSQAYLKQFNELFEELQAKKVGIFAVCAQPQAPVDKIMDTCQLKYKVCFCYSLLGKRSLICMPVCVCVGYACVSVCGMCMHV